MRIFARILLVAFFTASPLMAQIELKLSSPRTNYLLYEPAEMTVSIKNISGSDLVFESEKDKNLPWVSFQINSADDMPVDTDLPLQPPTKLIHNEEESTVSINITPYYKLRSSGRYEVRALVRLPGKGAFVTQPLIIWIGKGDVLWSQKRFVDGAERVYSLNRYDEHSKVYLYLRVEEPEQNLVYVTTRLGELNYSVPITSPIFDKDGNLHILHPSTATSFIYHVATSNGKILHKEELSTDPSTPQLISTPDKGVRVEGGTSFAKLKEKPQRPKLSEGQKFPKVAQEGASAPTPSPDTPDKSAPHSN